MHLKHKLWGSLDTQMEVTSYIMVELFCKHKGKGYHISYIACKTLDKYFYFPFYKSMSVNMSK